MIYSSVLFAMLVAACRKESVNSNGKNPYGDPVLPSITLKTENGTSPDRGYVNDLITIKGKGFLSHKDDLLLQFNGTAATIVELTDTTAKVRIPELASSGPISVQVGQEYYFGPYFQVFGPLQMDTIYPSSRGASSSINTITALPDGKFLIGGSFNNYDNANIAGGTNGVARINPDGTLDRTFTYGYQTGPGGTVSSSVFLPADQKYLVAGNFTRYATAKNVFSIARVNFNGTLDSALIELPSQNLAIGSSLAGGVSGSVNGLHLQQDGKFIVTGSFRYYVKPNYKLVSVTGMDSLHLDSTLMNYIARMYPDGTLDTSYNYDLVNHHGVETVNAAINASTLLPDGKLLIAGNFTKFNGQSVGRIARINTDGTLDATFNTGSGADLSIQDISVQPDGKILVAGLFNRFNGAKAQRVARLNADGSLDATFSVGNGPDGNAYKIGLMPGGQVIITGSFRKFNDIVRNNFVVLNADGSIHRTYNTNGGITLGQDASLGGVSRILQQPANKSMLIIGSFTKFDYRIANRIVQLKYQ